MARSWKSRGTRRYRAVCPYIAFGSVLRCPHSGHSVPRGSPQLPQKMNLMPRNRTGTSSPHPAQVRTMTFSVVSRGSGLFPRGLHSPIRAEWPEAFAIRHPRLCEIERGIGEIPLPFRQNRQLHRVPSCQEGHSIGHVFFPYQSVQNSSLPQPYTATPFASRIWKMKTKC